MEYDKGTQRLIDDLLALPESYDRNVILERARKLRDHDFDERGYESPKIALVKHLAAGKFAELVDRAKDGLYDQRGAEAAAWEERMRKEDPSSARIFDAMRRAGGRPPEEADREPSGPSGCAFGEEAQRLIASVHRTLLEGGFSPKEVVRLVAEVYADGSTKPEAVRLQGMRERLVHYYGPVVAAQLLGAADA